MMLTVEFPSDYPQSVPMTKLENLTPNYLQDKQVAEFETYIKTEADKNIGTQMMFDIT